MTVEAEPFAASDAETVATYCRIRTTVDPDRGDTPESVAWEETTYPGEVWRLLGRLDGEPVGVATVGRLHIFGPDHPQFYLGLWVLQHARHRGVGTAMYRAASDIARAAGKTGFRCWLSEASVEGVAFLRAAGFVEEDRSKTSRLDLRPLRSAAGEDAADPAVAAAPPEGFDIVTLADRPDLIPGVHRVAVEAYPSIPTATPMEPGSLEEFTAREVYRDRVPIDAYFVAVDRATGEAAGYANLILTAGSDKVAHHDMTAVRPAYRGRGIAMALKRATIAWATRAGLDELQANNDEENAAMRGINRRLGYTPLPDDLGMVGPLAPEA